MQHRLHRYAALLLGLVLLLTTLTTPALADPNCNPGGSGLSWSSVYLENVATSNVHVEVFEADIKVQTPDGGSLVSDASRTYIEIRQSSDKGVANLGIAYYNSTPFIYVYLRDTDGVVKINSLFFLNGDPLTQGYHRFRISHPDINHFYFYVDGVYITGWSGWFSGEFYANQKTLINGAYLMARQVPGGYVTPIRFLNMYTETQYGTVSGMPGTIKGAAYPKNMVKANLWNYYSWDSRCEW